MSYLVLARKYRPKTFTEVVGQEHVTRTLANAFDTGRVHHAFLFCGPRGVGKTTLARIVGKALNCEKGPTAAPCGVCSACETITSGTAVDYFEMDGASNRGIDSIRELTEAVRYQPAVLRKKVYVIDEVHMLTTEAFNALLKTLEEPPPHVSFVLATTEPHKIPNTILSRCQRYDFKLVPAQRLADHLTDIFKRESITIDAGAIRLLVRESGGSVRDSLSLCDQVISYVGASAITEAAVAEVLGVADRTLTRTLVSALASGDARTALEAVDAAVDRGVDEVQLARAIVRYLRDLAVVQVAPDADGLVEGTGEELVELAAQARAIERARVVQMFDRMLRACNDLGESQQPRLVLDLALIDVAALEPLIPLGDLIERLGSLERRLGGGGKAGPGSGASRGRPPARTSPGARSASAAPALPASAAPLPAAPAPVPVTPQPTAPVAIPAPAASHSVVASVEPPPAREAPARSAPAPEIAPRQSPSRRIDAAAFDDVPPPDDEPPSAALLDDEPPLQLPDELDRRSAGNGARPTAAPAPSSDPVPPPADALAEWENILDAFPVHKIPLTSFYREAKILQWDGRGVELGFSPEHSFAFEMASDQANVQVLKDVVLQRYSQPMNIRVRLMTPEESSFQTSARSVMEVSRQRADDERRQREAEVHKHPIYNKVIETFGAPVKQEINTNV